MPRHLGALENKLVFVCVDDNLIELEETLTGYRYMLYALHEHFHLKHPDWSETKVRRESSKTARFMWQMGFRLVELR